MRRRAHREGSLYRRGDGYWCASVRLPNGKRVTKYAHSKKEAAELLSDLRRQERAGRLAAPTKVTVSEWMDRWLRRRTLDLRPTTLRSYESVIRVHIKPALGELRLSRLSPSGVEWFITEVATSASHTAETARRILSMACEDAVTMGLMSANPVSALKSSRPRVRERTRWTTDEAARFIRTEHGRYGVLWRFLLGTGMRVGEALGLVWNDIDRRARTLAVERSLSWVGSVSVLGPPKTAAGARRLSLPSFVTQALEEWSELQAAERQAAGAGWRDQRCAVFTTLDGRSPHSSVLWQAFQRDCKRAGVPRMRIHDLRHVHASIAVSLGLDPKTVQARLGHSTLEMTLNVYSHAAPPRDAELSHALDEALNDASPAPVGREPGKAEPRLDNGY